MAIILITALIGGFGGGWLSRKTASIGPLHVDYERFSRKSVPFRIIVTVPASLKAGVVKLTIGSEMIQHAGILRTVPAATSAEATTDGVRYSFAVGPESEVILSVQPDRPGIFNWIMRAEGLGEASLHQVIYP